MDSKEVMIWLFGENAGEKHIGDMMGALGAKVYNMEKALKEKGIID